MSKKIYIIDGYNFLYRVFYAIPPFSLKDGTPVNAVFGMAKILLALHTEDRPDYLIFTLDSRSKVRMELYPEYKGTRDRMPDNLKIQESIIMEMLQVIGIQPIKVDGYEADDIIGTIVKKLTSSGFSQKWSNLSANREPEWVVRKYEERGNGDLNSKDEFFRESYNIFILSGDKDLYQFIDGNVAIYDTMKRKIYHTAEAREKFSVDPKHIVDYLAICGDSSDNIPGIPGFGPKKAESLINEYGTLENIYENIGHITGKTREILEINREIAFISKQLATIDTNVPLDNFSLEQHIFSSRKLLTNEVIDFFIRHDFRSLLPKEYIQTKDFSSLDLKQMPIVADADIDTCLKKLRLTKKISIGTYGERFELVGGSLYFGGDEIYTFETAVIDMKSFLKEALSGQQYEIIGYNLKKDLERIETYLEGNMSNMKEWQIALF